MKLLLSALYQLPLVQVPTYRGVKLELFEVSDNAALVASEFGCKIDHIQCRPKCYCTKSLNDQQAQCIRHMRTRTMYPMTDVQPPNRQSVELAELQFHNQEQGNASRSKWRYRLRFGRLTFAFLSVQVFTN